MMRQTMRQPSFRPSTRFNSNDLFYDLPSRHPPATLLLDLREDLGVAEEVVLLYAYNSSVHICPEREEGMLTSSPTLIAFPPQPGSSTRSPGFTFVGMILPSLSGAPGPTAMTVASGSGFVVEEDGRKIPVVVF